MRATVMYAAGDVRIETVPDARLMKPSDALVRVSRAAICGSDLWPYKSMEPTGSGRRMRHEFIRPTLVVDQARHEGGFNCDVLYATVTTSEPTASTVPLSPE